MILNDLILSPVDCAIEAVNDPHLHFDNKADGVEGKVRYVMTERTSHLVASDLSLIFDQVNSVSFSGGVCTLLVVVSGAWLVYKLITLAQNISNSSQTSHLAVSGT